MNIKAVASEEGWCVYISRRMLRVELPCRRPGGEPKSRFMDVVKEDIRTQRKRLDGDS